jgi:thiol:disulfide interchange protein DsbD
MLGDIRRLRAPFCVALALSILAAASLLRAGPSEEGSPFGGGEVDPVSLSARAEPGVVPAGGTVRLTATLSMQPGWHVNSHRPLEDWLIATELGFADSSAIEVLSVTYPPEKRLQLEFSEVPVSVYEGRAPIVVEVRIAPDLPAGPFVLAGEVYYQACNDKTCKAPTAKPFRVDLTLLPGSGEAAGGGVQSRLEDTLARHFGNPLFALLLVLLAGLLSAATPCVYPMIPITVQILMGRGGGNPALGRLHSLMYFLGIILVYAVLGVIASTTGGGFNEIMRIPWIIFGFAVLFALLGLSMLGFFEIQIPGSIATRVDSSTGARSGLWGTMLMGVGAGLVVSPCVGPVVIFILTQIAAQTAAIEAAGGGTFSTAGKIAYGGYLMAGYGAGLGVPFLVVGLFSAPLAQPRGWMTYVRILLGVVILWFARDYFYKALDTAGVPRGFADAILAGVVLIFLAVIWGVFRPRIEEGIHAGWHRVRHAVTVIMLVAGVVFLWTGLSRSGLVPGAVVIGGIPGVDVRADTGERAAVERHGDVVWQRDFGRARELARESNLPIFVDFYAHWCANCKKFGHQAAQPGPLQDALKRVVAAKVYDTDPVFETFRSDPRYPELKVGLPFFLLLSADGELLWKGTDYQAHDTMIAEIEKALAGRG